MQYLLALGAVTLSSIILYGLSIWFGRRNQVLDKPGPDVPKRERVVTLLWLPACVAIFLLPWLLWMPELRAVESPFFSLWIWIALVWWVSFVDELWRIVDPKYRISAPIRLGVHILAALIALLWSGVWIDIWSLLTESFVWPVLESIWIGSWWVLLSAIATVAWFLLCINSINWMDWVYGAATWLSSLWFYTISALITFVVLPWYESISLERESLLVSVALVSCGIWIITTIGARLEVRPIALMRDVWTMTFWFALAYLALLWWAKIWTLLVVLMIPLLDAIWVIGVRLFVKKKNPLGWDFSHVHFRLLALWWNRAEIRAFLWIGSLVLMIVMMLLWTDQIAKVIVFVISGLLFFGLNWYLFIKKWLPDEYDWKTHG